MDAAMKSRINERRNVVNSVTFIKQLIKLIPAEAIELASEELEKQIIESAPVDLRENVKKNLDMLFKMNAESENSSVPNNNA